MVTKQVSFNMQVGHAEEGKLTIDFVPPSGYGGAEVYIGITHPATGLTVKAIGEDPDFTITGDTTYEWDGVDIPLADDDSYLSGTYEIRVEIRVLDDGNDSDEVNTLSYVLCGGGSGCLNTVSITATVKCVKGTILINDTTDYSTVDMTSYLLKLIPPTIPGVTLTELETTDEVLHSIQTNFAYTRVTYQANVLAEGTRTSTSGSFVTTELLTFSGYKDIYINCSAGMCELNKAAETTMLELEKCLEGSNLVKYNKILKYLALINASQGCTDCTDLETYVNALMELVDCDCDFPAAAKYTSICGDTQEFLDGAQAQVDELIAGYTDIESQGADGLVSGEKFVIVWTTAIGDGTAILSLDAATLVEDRVYKVIKIGGENVAHTLASVNTDLVYDDPTAPVNAVALPNTAGENFQFEFMLIGALIYYWL